MPKRSNDFQRIVYLIQKILGDSAVVQESTFLKDRETGSDVEVDILITGEVGGTSVTIGVECVNRSRPSDIEWMRSMLKKHEDLPIDKSIFVSKEGFTSQAIKKARINGADTLTFAEVETHDWISELKGNDNLKISTCQLTVINTSIKFKEQISQDIMESFSFDALIYCESNPNGISLAEYGSSVVRRHDVFEEVTRHWLSLPKEERKNIFGFTFNITPDEEYEIEFGGICYPVDGFSFKVKGEMEEETPLNFEVVEYNKKVIVYSSFDNIFPESADEHRNAIFTLVEQDGKRSGLLSIPNFKGEGDKEFPMIFPKSNEETNN